MPELRGVAASPGVVVGIARRLDGVAAIGDDQRVPDAQRPDAVQAALRALGAAGAQLQELAADLNRRNRPAEAEILETGVLMAADPQLRDQVTAAIIADGLSPAGAILMATEASAQAVAALDSEMLAARAADVRSLGRRAARLATGAAVERDATDFGGDQHAGTVVVADDLGPADVVELGPEVCALALAGGGVTGHAAIVARSMGLPAVVGLGDALLAISDGESLLVDGGAGTVLVSPSRDAMATARTATDTRLRLHDEAAATRDLPTLTKDSHLVHVLANVSSAAEVSLALDEGADGVGLLRTELGLLDVRAWPGATQHRQRLEPILRLLAGRPATVRVLDFGGDKMPPFLAGCTGRGVQLLRDAPQALEAQLEAIVTTGGESDLGILIPMVIEPDDVSFVRRLLEAVMTRNQIQTHVRVGAMIEVPAAVAMLGAIAPQVDFVSIGTNDLSHYQLGLDRTSGGVAPAHHPAVLRLIQQTVDAAREAGVAVAVCGEAASHPVAMPLLIGLGVVELSVGAARVGEVRRWVRQLDRGRCAEVARRALGAESATDVEVLSAPLRASFEVG